MEATWSQGALLPADNIEGLSTHHRNTTLSEHKHKLARLLWACIASSSIKLAYLANRNGAANSSPITHGMHLSAVSARVDPTRNVRLQTRI